MADLKQTLVDIARAIVDNPDEVSVTSIEEDNVVTLKLTVAKEDMGRVIGRHGRVAKAIRLVIKSAAIKSGKKANVDIEE